MISSDSVVVVMSLLLGLVSVGFFSTPLCGALRTVTF